ncbi:hypothetical protein [Lichenicoccus sp.]|uniref:hypothetical protein n=1 Tax=Lichenicoccus sp. TaxID=2781899 RepID=UPI003D13A71C
MYFWLFVAVIVVWLWLAGGSFFGWRRGTIGGWLSSLSILVWTGAAAAVLLFVGPYWQVIYWVLLQPG